MEWLGQAKIDFITSPQSLPLREKGADGKATNLLEVCKAGTPPCRLNPLLFNGHLQTFWTQVDKSAPPVHYKRRIFEADHREFNGSFAVDFVVVPATTKEREEEAAVVDDDSDDDAADGDAAADGGSADDSMPPRTTYYTEGELANLGSDDDRPMLVVLHGLSGGSHENYLRHAISPLIESGKWEGCVVNSRGCAKSKITTGILYNARATWDVRQVVKWLRAKYPNRPLFGMGFSLGACILTNYLGEEGSACQLKAAVVCANPWNLEVSSKELKRTLIGHHVYQRVLGSAMRKLSATHKEEIEKYTAIDYDSLMQLTFLYEFDRAYQCPTWGYPTEEAYYRDASSVDSLMAVRVPTLALNTLDDPIAVQAALPRGEAAANPYTVLCTTSLGGHLGWYEVGGGRWHAKPIVNFLNHMAFEVDLDSVDRDASGKPDLGTKDTRFDPMRRRMFIHPE